MYPWRIVQLWLCQSHRHIFTGGLVSGAIDWSQLQLPTWRVRILVVESNGKGGTAQLRIEGSVAAVGMGPGKYLGLWREPG